MTPPSVSVILPTFRRPQFLRRCLRSLQNQTLSASAYEILVVDNGSGDDTPLVVASLATKPMPTPGQLPQVRYILEQNQGLSRAKNTGAAAARAPIVAYIDDDALACPHWLEHIVDAFENGSPRPHVVGGPAYPLLVGRRPAWFQDRYETASWGEQSRLLGPGEYFYGLNVAFDRDLLLRAGGFDPGLGMKGTALGFAEDAEVFDRLSAEAKGRLISVYLPQAYVLHLIPDERLEPLYRLKRYYVIGQTRAFCEIQHRPDQRTYIIARAARKFARTLANAASSSLVNGLPRHPATWAYGQGTDCALKLGYLAGALGFHTTVRRAP